MLSNDCKMMKKQKNKKQPKHKKKFEAKEKQPELFRQRQTNNYKLLGTTNE